MARSKSGSSKTSKNKVIDLEADEVKSSDTQDKPEENVANGDAATTTGTDIEKAADIRTPATDDMAEDSAGEDGQARAEIESGSSHRKSIAAQPQAGGGGTLTPLPPSAQDNTDKDDNNEDDEVTADGFSKVFLIVVAAFIGAGLALALQFVLETANLLPFGASQRAQANQQSISMLRTEFSNLRQQVDARLDQQPLTNGVSQDVENRIITLEETTATLTNRIRELSENSGNDLSGVSETIRALQSRIEAVESNPASDVSDLEENITALESALAENTQTLSQAVDQRLNAVEETLASLQQRLGSNAPEDRAALALAMNSLSNAVEKGEPFAEELDVITRLAPDINTDPLKSYAAEGLPTLAELRAQWRNAENAILEFQNTLDEDTSILKRLTDSAREAVKIRPNAETAQQGDSLRDQLVRIDSALQRERLTAALQEWQNLPEEAKNVSQDFGAALSAHVNATQAMQNVSDSIMTDLGRP
jgi:hypothetical protein